MKYTQSGRIYIYSLDALHLNVDKESNRYLEKKRGTFHALEGEFFYCDLLVDGKLILNEKQLDELLRLQMLPIHKVVNSIMYIRSFNEVNRSIYNALAKKVQHIGTENMDDDDDECELFLMN